MKEEHPILLPWYVSGAISPRDRKEVEAHLRECVRCREEAAILASVMGSIRIQSRVDHVEPAELTLYEEGPRSLDAGRRVAVERHLAECARCRDDMATLRRARASEVRAVAVRGAPANSRAGRRAILAAAAGLVIVLGLVAFWPSRFRPAAPEAPAGEIRVAVFPAPRRGAEARRTLRAPGPWAIRVLLPYGAREGRYRVEVRRVEGPVLPSSGTLASTDSDLRLDISLQELPGPGRYELLLRPEADPDGDSLRYPFEFLPAAGQRPDR